MRTMLLAAIALSGCLAEAEQRPTTVSHPMSHAADPPACVAESPTGSNINRTVCREPLSPDEKQQRTMLRGAYPDNPFAGGSHATDTPGVRVYP